MSDPRECEPSAHEWIASKGGFECLVCGQIRAKVKGPNRYRAGADFERNLKLWLEDCGYQVIRSAGSKGAADLVAFRVGTDPLLIQCKLSNGLIPPAERVGLMEAHRHLAHSHPIVAYREGDGRVKVWRFRRLTGTGPKEFEMVEFNEIGDLKWV